MKCLEAEHLILLQDSGELKPRQENALIAHLHDCEPCQRFQHALVEATHAVDAHEQPAVRTVQNVLREARLNAPEKKSARIIGFRPALAMAASLVICLGLFLSVYRPGQVGLEMVVNETQMLDAEDQMVSVMYSGLSEDDLAFNFLMTYEGNTEG